MTFSDLEEGVRFRLGSGALVGASVLRAHHRHFLPPGVYVVVNRDEDVVWEIRREETQVCYRVDREQLSAVIGEASEP